MNTQILEKIEKPQIKKRPDIKPGDIVRVHQKIKEGKKERVQVFEGVVLRVKGGGLRKSFIVRKISFGIGVEKSFLVHSPNIIKIEVKKRAKVRRAYLTYLRNLTGKKARLKDKQFDSLLVNVQDEKPEEEKSDEEGKQAQDSAEKEGKNKSKDSESQKETEPKVKNEKDSSSEEKNQDEKKSVDDEKEIAAEEIKEVPLEKVVKEENKEAAESAGDEIHPEDGGQDAEIEEVNSGLEKAEKAIEKGK